MNLLDHFHGPLKAVWPAYHNAWMGQLAGAMTDSLPRGFVAVPSTRFGIEIDVAALERLHDSGQDTEWEPTWTPPPATATVSFAIATDEFELRLLEVEEGHSRLVAAVEFVSPANKDRPETREAFVSKCHGYLQDGIGLMIVDVVTDRHANLHEELMARIGHPEEGLPSHLYATSYRPLGSNGEGTLDVWRHTLDIGRPLPTLPLWLLGGICVPADLSASYAGAGRELRIDRVLEVFGRAPATQPQ